MSKAMTNDRLSWRMMLDFAAGAVCFVGSIVTCIYDDGSGAWPFIMWATIPPLGLYGGVKIIAPHFQT